jgi:AraC-like DNA-binding protein
VGWARRSESTLGAGVVQLSEPGEVQRLNARGGPVSVFMIRWLPEALEREALDLGLPGPVHWQLPHLELGAHSASMKYLFEVLANGASEDVVVGAYRQATADLLQQAHQAEAARQNRPGHPRVRRSVERMAAELNDLASLTALAQEARLSKYHFVHCFRDAVGIAPHQYRKLLRVDRARRLLEGGMSVADAARQMGFSDASHLIRNFSSSIGVAPGLWSKAWRASDPAPARAPRTLPPSLPPEQA